MNEIMKRCKSLAFYGVPDSEGGYTYRRMKGFDEISTSKNPKEYLRKYVDEEFEQTDVIGYTPAISFGFDRFCGDEVHDDLAEIFTVEATGADAVRQILMVDMTSDEHTALLREFSVVAQNEGDGTDAYRYSGEFRAKGAVIRGTASSSDGWQSCTFTAGE